MKKTIIKLLIFLLAVLVFKADFSTAYFTDTEGVTVGISTGVWDAPVEEWDKSSLYFDEDYVCQGDCIEISSKVCNEEDSENMQGTTVWELYWIESGNPKDGEMIASGSTNVLEYGTCQILYYDPGENSEGWLGNYKFKAYQRPGHPGPGELWSETCEILQCEVFEE